MGVCIDHLTFINASAENLRKVKKEEKKEATIAFQLQDWTTQW